MTDEPAEGKRVPITSKNLRKAEEVVADSRDTHVQWLSYQQANPGWEDEAQPADIGDPEHHQRCIDDYDFVLGFLAQLRDSLGLD